MDAQAQPTELSIPTNSKPNVADFVDIEYDDDDDVPTLSPFALEALRQVLAEQNQHQQEVEERENGDGDGDGDGAVALVKEDWRLSQFWYSPETAIAVAQEVFSLLNELTGAGGDDECSVTPSVACISCPTLFAYLKKKFPDISVRLLEYDQRFQQYGSDFTFYDYNVPEELPQEMKHAYQIVVADPPYLSEECLAKVARTIRFLSHPGKFFVLLLTGEVQRDRAAKLLGLHPCGFRPEHSSKLGNEFRLYTNYDPGTRLGGWDLSE